MCRSAVSFRAGARLHNLHRARNLRSAHKAERGGCRRERASELLCVRHATRMRAAKTPAGRPGSTGLKPLEIPCERFARGEIDQVEYDQEASGHLARLKVTASRKPATTYRLNPLRRTAIGATRPPQMGRGEGPLSTCAVTRRRFSGGCKPHPATAPAGSDRSRHGGDEVSEAFG